MNYRWRTNAITKCFEVARERGYRVFAVQDGGWCSSSATGLGTYTKYGEARNCENGKGGVWASDIYRITCGMDINLSVSTGF